MKKISLNILLMSILAVWVLVLVGCHSAARTTSDAVMGIHDTEAAVIGGHGLGETETQRADDHSHQLRLTGSELVDDIDAWWQTDRTSRLTEFSVR